MLDGEGGFTVWGKLMPATTSLALGGLPLGLAHDVKLTRAVGKAAEPHLGRRVDGRVDSGAASGARWNRCSSRRA